MQSYEKFDSKIMDEMHFWGCYTDWFHGRIFSYSRVNISPEIAQSNSATVLITTFRGMSQTQTLSFNFKLDDPSYIELSGVLLSSKYRKCLDQNLKSHDLSNQSEMTCIDIRFYSEEDVQVFMEIWSDGVMLIDEEYVDIWFSGISTKDFYHQVLDLLNS